jgi:invasion protein IalB
VSRQTTLCRNLRAVLTAGAIGCLAIVPGARAQSGQESMPIEKFGPWTVACSKELIFHYVFCNTYYAETLSESGAMDFVRFGVARTHGSERVGLNTLNGVAPGSDVVIRVDEGSAWTLAGASAGEAVLASPAQSKEMIERMLAGKAAHVRFTPNGAEPRELDLSLAEFPAALNRARAMAE